MTKTCKNCKHLNRELAFCRACGAKWINDNSGANCKYFEKITPPTNGDVIRKMSNEEWATIWSEQAFLFAWCYDCMEYCKDGNTPEEHAKCKKQMLNWLNAPAESEGKDDTGRN